MDTFHTLAEIAVAVTGFTSLIFVFRGRTASWNRQDYVSLTFALCWGIGSLFLSLLPVVLVEFGFTLAAAARAGLIVLAVYMLLVGNVLTYVRRRIAIAEAERARISIGMTLLYAVIVLLALSAGFHLLPGPMHAWYVTAIVLLMLHATAEMGLFVLQSIRRADPL